MNLKIATYNIHHGLKLKQITENLQTLSNEGVVFFCLQEVQELGGGLLVLEACIKALGVNWEHEGFFKTDNHNVGLYFFWQTDVFTSKKLEKIILPEISKSNIRVMVKNIKQLVGRGALVGTFEFNGGSIRISNVHLDCHGQFVQREKQLKFLVQHLSSDSSFDKEIICGDFNTIGAEALSRKQEKKILEIFGSAFINAYPKRTLTFPNFFQRLDYIFVKNIKVSGAKVIKLKGSDHFPLVAHLEI